MKIIYLLAQRNAKSEPPKGKSKSRQPFKPLSTSPNNVKSTSTKDAKPSENAKSTSSNNTKSRSSKDKKSSENAKSMPSENTKIASFNNTKSRSSKDTKSNTGKRKGSDSVYKALSVPPDKTRRLYSKYSDEPNA